MSDDCHGESDLAGWYCVGHSPTQWALFANGRELAILERQRDGSWRWGIDGFPGGFEPSRLEAMKMAEKALHELAGFQGASFT